VGRRPRPLGQSSYASARFPKCRSRRLGLGQSGGSLSRPYRYTCPPGSRADLLNVSDEFVMMGVGRPPLNVRSFHFSRYDVTRRRDMTSDDTTWCALMRGFFGRENSWTVRSKRSKRSNGWDWFGVLNYEAHGPYK